MAVLNTCDNNLYTSCIINKFNTCTCKISLSAKVIQSYGRNESFWWASSPGLDLSSEPGRVLAQMNQLIYLTMLNQTAVWCMRSTGLTNCSLSWTICQPLLQCHYFTVRNFSVCNRLTNTGLKKKRYILSCHMSLFFMTLCWKESLSSSFTVYLKKTCGYVKWSIPYNETIQANCTASCQLHSVGISQFFKTVLANWAAQHNNIT